MKQFKTLLAALVMTLGMNSFTQAQKVAHINFEEIVSKMPETLKLQADLEKLGKTYGEEITNAQKALKAKIDKYTAEEVSQTAAQNEARIKEVEGILKNYEIIKKDKSQLVSIGKTVVLQLGDLPEQEFTLVGSLEADPIKKRISNESPIGKGIIGSKKGDTLVVKTETGRDVVVTIINVK